MGLGVAAIVLSAVVIFVGIMLAMEFFSDPSSGDWNWNKIALFTVAFFLLLLSCSLVCNFINPTPNSNGAKERCEGSCRNCRMEASSKCSYWKCHFQRPQCHCYSSCSHSCCSSAMLDY